MTRPPMRRPFRPRLEWLEGRALPTTLTDLPKDDSRPGSLRQALADAQKGDTIDFAPDLRGQTIRLTSGELVVDKSLDVEGLGAADLAVSGNDASRVFDISGDGVAVTLAGLTLTHGKAPAAGGMTAQGGGIYAAGAALTLSHCALTANQAAGSDGGAGLPGGSGEGGGVYLAGGVLTVDQSALSANRAA